MARPAETEQTGCDRALFGYCVLLVAMIAGFLLALGGQAGLQNECRGTSCDDMYRYSWWIIFYSLLTWVGMVVVVFRKTLFQYQVPLVAFLAVPLVAFLAVGASQTMPLANSNLLLWNACIATNELVCATTTENNLSAAAAGFVLLSICNFIWIVIAGSSRDSFVATHTPVGGVAEKIKHQANKKRSMSNASAAVPSAVTKWDMPSPQRPLSHAASAAGHGHAVSTNLASAETSVDLTAVALHTIDIGGADEIIGGDDDSVVTAAAAEAAARRRQRRQPRRRRGAAAAARRGDSGGFAAELIGSGVNTWRSGRGGLPGGLCSRESASSVARARGDAAGGKGAAGGAAAEAACRQRAAALLLRQRHAAAAAFARRRRRHL
ncbi:hypothetical protein JKP88DRAFT_282701 [Tribonema minus]|uniref:DAD domain-containing protein n=1 Tax=Tribonema minus TaxID=303371 RepID=A0A836C9V9_9STRA|nr:hypothetical protein JKP88DRAFT_282701 [Tribonema minus]